MQASLLTNSLVRSKSYDTRLNYNQENSDYYDNDDYEDVEDSKIKDNIQYLNSNHTTRETTSDDHDANNQTKIIITSFGPEPKKKNLQLRPSSHASNLSQNTNNQASKNEASDNNL